jgi:hypothetical protein
MGMPGSFMCSLSGNSAYQTESDFFLVGTGEDSNNSIEMKLKS